MGLGWVMFAAAAAVATAAVGRFLFPNAVAARPSRFKVGRLKDYRPGRVETRFVQSHGVWVVCGERGGRPQVFALAARCTHLGCVTVWHEGERKFKCPCHGSGFRPDGVNIEGPAPRPLPRCAIRLAPDGQLEVDSRRVFQAELGQWDDPASFVSV
jgi:cytochrome b6-f complex iron-sulfur subunit